MIVPLPPNFCVDGWWLGNGYHVEHTLLRWFQQRANDSWINGAVNVKIIVFRWFIGPDCKIELPFRPGGTQVRQVPGHVRIFDMRMSRSHRDSSIGSFPHLELALQPER